MTAATKGFIDKVIAKNVLYQEVKNSRGDPFRSLMPQLRGVTVRFPVVHGSIQNGSRGRQKQAVER